MKTTTKKLKTITELAVFSTIIVVLEYLFLSLPNISLTPLLFAVYFAARSYKQSFYLVSIYMFVEILQWGISLWVAPMWLGWMIWAVIVKTTPIYLPIKGIAFAYLYGVLFMPLTVIVYGVDPIAYLIADFPFATNMAIGNALSLLLLEKSLTKVMNYDIINI